MTISVRLKRALALLVLVLPLTSGAEIRAETEDITVVRRRFISDLLETAPDASEVRELLSTLSDNGSWPDINYKDVSNTGWEHDRHWANMLTLSAAYRHPGSAFRGRASVRSAVLAALDFWLERDFQCKNWYKNIISTPRDLSSVLLLMNEELSDAQQKKAYAIADRANMKSRWARSGADRSRIAGIIAKMALVKRDPEAMRRAIEVMSKAVHVTSQRGVQADMSYQHRNDHVTSTLTYGIAYIRDSARMARKVAGTAFEFPENKQKLMIDFYLDGIAKSMAHGHFIDPQQENRGISRRRTGEMGAAVPLMLMEISSYRRDELKELIAVRREERAPDYRFNKYFWRSAYQTHQRPEYFTSVRMYSKRNRSMEMAYNEEGLQNHYLADGANFLIRTGQEYRNIFPVYDWRKIPGTTVVQKKGMPHPNEIQQAGRTDFVGGVSDGIYGAAVFDFDSPLDDLKAKKAWFFFDREYVCLGAGIRSGETHPVATTVNQSLLNGRIVALDAQGARVVPRGEHKLRKPRVVWHDQVAYIFNEEADVRLKNDKAKGSWWRITRQAWARGATVQKDRFMLWIDHGTAPENADYAYLVVPGLKPKEVDAYVAAPPVRILSNTSELQAVAHAGLGFAFGIFHEAGVMSIPNGPRLDLARPGLALCRMENGRVRRLAVADPTAKLARMKVSLDMKLSGNGKGWKAEWNDERGQTDIKVDLPRGTSAGKSVIMDFSD